MKSLLLLAIYTIIIFTVTAIFTRRSRTTDEFLVADRAIHWWPMSLSIAATWTQAPAVFVSASIAFTGGLSGYTWFFLPNVLSLMLFAWLSVKIRRMYPRGFTLAGFMNKVYGRGVQKVYLFQFIIVSMMLTGLQLFAGTTVLKILSPGLSIMTYNIIVMAIVLGYSLYSGIAGDIVTDVFQMYMIVIPLALFFITLLFMVPSVGTAIVKGLGGASGTLGNPFSKTGAAIFLNSGVFTIITLMTAPTGDQSYWQRIFAMKKEHIRKAFIAGALEFSIVPILMGCIGFIMVGSGFKPQNMSVGNFEYIIKMFPAFFSFIFIFMVMSALLSTVDSHLCAFSSLMTDIVPKKYTLKGTRWMMLVLAAGALIITALPGTTITTLFLTYGTTRASTFIITLFSTMHVKFNEEGVKWGILIPMIVGTGLFMWGSIVKVNDLRLVGALSSLLLPPIIAWVTTLIVNGRSYYSIPAGTVYED